MCIVHGDRTKQETRRFERLNEAMSTADTHSLRTALVAPSPHTAHHTRVFPVFESRGSRRVGLLDRSLEVQVQVRHVISALMGDSNGD